MTPQPESFQTEIQRIQDVYHQFDSENRMDQKWAPFNNIEAAYRCRQALVFSSLMCQAGFMSLKGIRILDVGCGTGRILRTFVDMGAAPGNLYGIDINVKSINSASFLSPDIHFSVGNGIEVEFPSNSFDLVTQFVVFSSIRSINLQRQLASEMLRVLKPGGYIFWWDMITMSQEASRTHVKLNPDNFFSMPKNSILTSRFPLPADTLRPLKGIARLFAPLINLFAYPRTHRATLYGPKPA